MKVPPDLVIHQRSLYKQLRALFPNHTIHENTRTQSTVKYPATSSFMEFDIWIPTLNVCFEFQDNYHYETTWYYQRPLTYVQNKDNIKRDMVSQAGFSLVVIPCWWSGDRESLQATINFCRPDLIGCPCSSPVPLNPTLGFFKPTYIPDVYELMLASFPKDPNTFRLSLERRAWWIGEKYDGVRCCWNAKHRKLYTRHGRVLELLQSVSYPSIFIDGELWFGRGQFSLAYTLEFPEVQSWQFLRMIAFDVPAFTFGRKLFEERYSMLLSNISRNDPFTAIAMRVSCKGPPHVEKFLEFVISDGGEGLILRKKRTFYERGRSTLLVKLKSAQRDKEAVVLDKREDNSVVLKLPNGKKFTVPAQFVHVPKLAVGDVVTISYEVHARREVPVSPSISRIRTDVSWEDVVLNYRKDSNYLNDNASILELESKSVSPQMFEQMRIFVENFATARNLDPLSPETWRKIPLQEFRNTKGGRAILLKFKGEGRYFNMLQTLFPDIGLQKSDFPQRYAHDIDKRREYFESYAKRKGFDPKKPENWIGHTKRSMVASQGGGAIWDSIPGGYYKALEVVFPELGFDSFHKYSWEDAGNRRKFFEAFAKENQFDPLNAENWYSITREHVLSYKGANRILVYHAHSFSQALLDLFPSIGLDASRLPQHNIWGDANRRRKFFESYAEDNGFDPRKPENWYLQSRNKMLSYKGAVGVLSYHNHQVAQALLDLFPDIGLDETKLRPWQNADTRRKFFEEYAKRNNFDPLNPINWYHQPAYRFFATQYAKRVLSYHQGSMKIALLDLFPEIGLVEDHFNLAVEGKMFFETYAKIHKFDPLVPENWYRQSLKDILAHKGSRSVRERFNSNLATALLNLFPSIGLRKSELRHLETTPREGKTVAWSDEKQRRKFFEDFAVSQSFDPLAPSNWYSVTRDQITSVRGSGAVLFYYNKNITKALCSLFPDIGLDPAKFSPCMAKKPQKSVAI